MSDKNKQTSSALLSKLGGGDEPTPDMNTALGADYVSAGRAVRKAEGLLNDIKNTTSDPDLAYQRFASESEKSFQFNSMSIEPYWNLREQAFPGSREEFQKYETTRIDAELGSLPSDDDRAGRMVDIIDRGPLWMRDRYEPMLADHRNSKAGYEGIKANAELRNERVMEITGRLEGQILDTEVSRQTHLDDLARIEAFNKGGALKVVSGRIGFDDGNGQFVPGYAVEGNNDMVEGEAVLRSEALNEALDTVIDRSLSRSRMEAKVTKQAEIEKSRVRLAEGNLAREDWMPLAAAIGGDESNELEVIKDVIMNGLAGEIASGRSRGAMDDVSKSWPFIIREMNKYYGGQ